jgi:acetylornithine/N-succinyldiaminopimelate aminotransferase
MRSTYFKKKGGGLLEKLRIEKWSDWIDFTSGGIFAAIFGGDWWPKLHAPMASCYGAHYKNDTTDRYIDMLKEFTGFDSVALFSTGAEATEAFWRVCRVYNGKPGIWGGLIDPDEVLAARTTCDAMHGVTLGALIMAGKIDWPGIGSFRELGAGRFGLAQEATSGMIIEPYHAASAQFHRIDPTINRIKGLHDKFPDIPLCIDEVQGGFGRTGKLFAWEWYEGLKPDFVCIGKAQGGGFPISALLGPKEIMEDKIVIENAHLHSTHSGHPAMCEIGT